MLRGIVGLLSRLMHGREHPGLGGGFRGAGRSGETVTGDFMTTHLPWAGKARGVTRRPHMARAHEIQRTGQCRAHLSAACACCARACLSSDVLAIALPHACYLPLLLFLLLPPPGPLSCCTSRLVPSSV
eukprot:8580082-Alexandrium_andersonii.AAC.1